jgi:hypothetical protein
MFSEISLPVPSQQMMLRMGDSRGIGDATLAGIAESRGEENQLGLLAKLLCYVDTIVIRHAGRVQNLDRIMATPEERYPEEIEEFYRATGEVIREWTELEEILTFHLSVMLGTDQFRSQVIWNSLPTGRPRFRLLSKLSETFLADEAAAKFHDLIKRVGTISRNRNMLAHAHGGVGARVGTVVFIWDDEDREIGFNFIGEHTIQISNIRSWAKDIVLVRNELMQFLPEMRSSVCERPKMHQQQRGDLDRSAD